MSKKQNQEELSDKFAENLIAEVETRPAQITCDDMDRLEDWWRNSTRERRAALLMLTQPFVHIQKETMNDEQFAEAIAQTLECVSDVIGGLQDLLEYLEVSKVWMMVALAGREDMRGIREKAIASLKHKAA